MRFAGDAFNNIVRTGGLDPFLGIGRQPGQPQNPRHPDREWWDDFDREKPRDDARSAAWKQVRGNRIVDLNNKHVIGDATLPEEYGEFSGAYERAVVDLATRIQMEQGMPPISAVAAAMRQVNPSDYLQGAPPQASYLHRFADASRNPGIRKVMDLPENGEDEWGVLLNAVEAIQAHDRMSRPSTGKGVEDDLFPF
jgi:hypothetical protein